MTKYQRIKRNHLPKTACETDRDLSFHVVDQNKSCVIMQKAGKRPFHCLESNPHTDIQKICFSTSQFRISPHRRNVISGIENHVKKGSFA